jgi:glycosyltransferase involved in cell wall biosynthesis
MHEPNATLRIDGGKRSSAVVHRFDSSRHQPTWPTVTVVIPTLNEAENLRWLLPRLVMADEIIVVDGHSTDDTLETVATLRPDALVVSQPPTGKGAAMRAGFAEASMDVIVSLDADGSMDPKEIEAFVALIRGGFDMVKGSRYCCGGGSDDLTFVRRTGNRWLTRLANVMYRTHWTDLCYGYIALRRTAVGGLGLAADGFEIETELCLSARRRGLRIAEVPSYELRRLTGESKLNAGRDGLRILRVMLLGRRAAKPAKPAEPITGYDTYSPLEDAG